METHGAPTKITEWVDPPDSRVKIPTIPEQVATLVVATLGVATLGVVTRAVTPAVAAISDSIDRWRRLRSRKLAIMAGSFNLLIPQR
jgi:hypothetical protein